VKTPCCAHGAAFQYETKHPRRNFGTLIAFFFTFQVMAMIAIEATQGIPFPFIVIFERKKRGAQEVE